MTVAHAVLGALLTVNGVLQLVRFRVAGLATARR
jgi:hypothetical protein